MCLHVMLTWQFSLLLEEVPQMRAILLWIITAQPHLSAFHVKELLIELIRLQMTAGIQQVVYKLLL